MKHGFLDFHAEGDGPLVRLDPRVKIISSLAIVIGIVTTSPGRFLEYPCYAIFLGTILGISKFPVLPVLKRSLMVVPFSLMLALFLPFYHEGNPVAVGLGLLTVTMTDRGIDLFLAVLFKSYLSFLAIVILSASTKFERLLKGLEGLGFPQVGIMILSFLYRYIFLLADEMERLIIAREARGFGMTLGRSWESLAGIAGILFLRTYERGERVYAAMCARGFDGRIVILDPLKVSQKDLSVGFIVLFMAVGIKVACFVLEGA